MVSNYGKKIKMTWNVRGRNEIRRRL